MSAELPAKKSNASRYLFLFLLGLVVGAVAAVMGLRAWQQRQDPFPDAVMHVMGKHSGLLQQTIQQNRCAATDTVPHLRTLRAMANDLETAFPGLSEDQRFSTHASQFRAKLDAAIATPPTDCAAATQVGEQVKESCKGCHQDFRG
ncbi:MAG: cytochrome c [Pseudoxanthomonas sp.]